MHPPSHHKAHAMSFLLLLTLWTGPAQATDPGAIDGPRRDAVPLYRPYRASTKPYVEARLPGGRRVLFLVDTGADISVLHADIAAELELVLDRGAAIVTGVAAEATVDLAVLPTVSIGAFTLHDVRIAVNVPGQGPRHGQMPVAGILGNNVWSRFTTEVDQRADLLVLSRPGRRKMPRRSASLRYNGHHPTTAVQLRPAGSDQHATVVLLVDTGATGLLLQGPLDSVLAEATTEGMEPVMGLGADDDGPRRQYLQTTRRVPIQAVVAGGRRMRVDLEARWIEGPEDPNRQGLLGYAVLDGQRLVLDYAGGRIRIAPSLRLPHFRDGHALALARDIDRFGDRSDRAVPRARLQAALDDARAAEAGLRRRVDDAPDDDEARIWLARLLRADGRFDEAIDLLVPVGAVALGEERELVASVRSLVLADRLSEAKRLVRDADLGTTQGVLATIEVALAEGDLPRAADLLSRSAGLTGATAELARLRARLALAEGDRAGATSFLRAAALSDPLDGALLWTYARAALPDDRATLTADLEALPGTSHPSLRPWDYLAGAHALLGDDPAAATAAIAGRARDCEPIRGAARDNCLAWYAALVGEDLDLALRRVHRALRRAGRRPGVLDTLSAVHAARGELEAARAAALEATRRAPADDTIAWQRIWLELALAIDPPHAL